MSTNVSLETGKLTDGHRTSFRSISQFVNSFGTHDPQISTDLLHYGYVSLVHFRRITFEVMEVLHEYLLFAPLRRILPPVQVRTQGGGGG